MYDLDKYSRNVTALKNNVDTMTTLRRQRRFAEAADVLKRALAI